jgi:putative peptidoglycan lipid II flippase
MTSLFRATTIVSLLTLGSRVLGFARDVLMFQMLGATWVTGTFFLAWSFPNMLRRWFGEGALSASFLPVYARTLDQQGPPAAARLLGGVTGGLLLGLALLAGLASAIALLLPPESLSLAPSDGIDPARRGALLLELTALLLPYVLPICLVAIYGAALNARGSFAPPAFAPIVLNLFWIGALLLLPSRGRGDPASVLWLSAFLLAGGVAQLAAVLWPLWRQRELPPPRLPRSGEPARDVFRAMLPAALGLSFGQLTVLVNQGIAWTFIDPAANGFVYLADRLVLFPHALTSLALATAMFPRLSLLAARDDRRDLRRQLNDALQVTLFLSVPASAGLALIGPDLFRVCFVGPRFTPLEAELAATTTAYLVAGLPFLGIAQLLARALYSTGDLRTPARVAALLFGANLLLAPGLALGLGLGIPGLTLAMSVASLINAVLLYARVHALCGGPHPGGRALLRILGATAAMLPAVLLLRGRLGLDGRLGAAIDQLALPIAAGIAAFLLATHWLGGDELRRLRRRVTRPA